jgi:hypothetical protein
MNHVYVVNNNLGGIASRGDVVTNSITVDDTSETVFLDAAPDVYHDLTTLILSNTSSTKVIVTIRDSIGGDVRMSLALAVDGGGAVISFPVPMPQGSVNSDWTIQLSANVTDVRVTAVAITR